METQLENDILAKCPCCHAARKVYNSTRLGVCYITEWESKHTAIVVSKSGNYYRVSGLSENFKNALKQKLNDKQQPLED
ncbi:hypothetical protein LCGC14_2207330 [marine sediment metagenome]|uniref:Uncharacterized protein n=1 Tax=marine sediment metagenome TaxID=412755 RepID=A0A0F9DEP9_9ZZZZ